MERKPPVKISILERDESEVSHCWKYCQLFSYILVVISGVATSFSMGTLQRIFHHECILYADLAVAWGKNWTILIVPHSASRWGTASHCAFCQFCPVSAVIFAGIWGTIFVICGRGGASSRNLPQPWRIIPPAILFNTIFLALSCVGLALTFGGFSAFCDSIAPQLNLTSCEDLVDIRWEKFPDATTFYDDMVMSQVGAAIGFIGWALGSVILIIRVITHADFRVIGPDRKSSAAASNNTICIPSAPNLSASSNSSNVSSQNCSNNKSSHPRCEGEPLINRGPHHTIVHPNIHNLSETPSRSNSISSKSQQRFKM